MRPIVLAKALDNDKKSRDLNDTHFAHFQCKLDAKAGLKVKAGVDRTTAVMWRALTSLKNAYPSATSTATTGSLTAGAGHRIHNHPAYRALVSELEHLRMQKLIAESELATVYVVDACDNPKEATAYIQQQWTLTGRNPNTYRSLITSVSRSAAFSKFLTKNKSKSSARKQSRESRWEERYSDGESDEDDQYATKKSRNQKGNNAKKQKGKGKGGKGGGGGGAATKP